MNTRESTPWTFCVAPMMDWTDRHCRYFHRLLSPHARLYTEMVTAPAVIHGDRERLLGFDAAEHPVALQLGGADPIELAAAARIGADFGYAEINLNVGCPSDRVQSGRFGACLMQEPALVADCVAAMRAAVADAPSASISAHAPRASTSADAPRASTSAPASRERVEITVKCRLGVDAQDEYADLQHFIDTVRGAGCTVFAVHARKAWLQGLSPKQNREVPPLNHARVYQLKRDFPELTVIVNGGIDSVVEIRTHLEHVDGVMLGRTAYHEPFRLAEVEADLFGTPLPDRADVLRRLQPFVEAHLAAGGRLQHIARHLLGLFQGLPGARAFRRTLSEQAHRSGAGYEVIERALAAQTGTTSDRAAWTSATHFR